MPTMPWHEGGYETSDARRSELRTAFVSLLGGIIEEEYIETSDTTVLGFVDDFYVLATDEELAIRYDYGNAFFEAGPESRYLKLPAWYRTEPGILADIFHSLALVSFGAEDIIPLGTDWGESMSEGGNEEKGET
jgi:hypothetical protein